MVGSCVCVSQLQTYSCPAVPRSGHQGVNSDILSNCIILLSMLTADVIFHRSVLIIRAWFSQRGPTWYLRPFAIGLSISLHTSPAFCTSELFKKEENEKEGCSYVSCPMEHGRHQLRKNLHEVLTGKVGRSTELEHKDLTFMFLSALLPPLYDHFGLTAWCFNVLINSSRPCSHYRYVPCSSSRWVDLVNACQRWNSKYTKFMLQCISQKTSLNIKKSIFFKTKHCTKFIFFFIF